MRLCAKAVSAAQTIVSMAPLGAKEHVLLPGLFVPHPYLVKNAVAVAPVPYPVNPILYLQAHTLFTILPGPSLLNRILLDGSGPGGLVSTLLYMIGLQ